MSLVSYDNDSSDEEQEEQTTGPAVVTHRLNLPTPIQTVAKKDEIPIEDDDEPIDHSSNLLSNLPKPQQDESTNDSVTTMEFPEGELEDIVRVENKAYAKDLPQAPKPMKRKRDGPVKIFLPTVEQDSDDEDQPKRRLPTTKGKCPLLNVLPPPKYDEDQPTTSMPVVSNPSATTPQITPTGLFIPHSVSQKKSTKTATPVVATNSVQPAKNLLGIEDDDEDVDGSDFLGLTKSDQIQISTTDVESVLRETFPKARPTPVEQAAIVQAAPQSAVPDFEDLDDDDHNDEDNIHQSTTMVTDDDELLKYLPKSERYKEIKSVHIDSMLGEQARLQLLKNVTEERETIKAQAAIQVPKGELRKRAQITYLIAKAKSDDLQLKNMWSEQKLTKRQTQAKYGF